MLFISCQNLFLFLRYLTRSKKHFSSFWKGFQVSENVSYPRVDRYGWQSLCVSQHLTVCHHPDKSCGHKHYDSGEAFNLSRDLLWTHAYRVMWIYGRKPKTSFIIFWDFSLFYQIFLSQQVKRCAIITYKHGIYKLPQELLNDLRLRNLGNIRKLTILHRMIAQCPVPPPLWKFC